MVTSTVVVTMQRDNMYNEVCPVPATEESLRKWQHYYDCDLHDYYSCTSGHLRDTSRAHVRCYELFWYWVKCISLLLPLSYLATYCQLIPCQEKQVHNHVCVCAYTFFFKRCNSALVEHMTSSASPGAGAVIHTHSKAAVMATLLFPGREFKITHQEMIKGIKKCTSGGYYRYIFSLFA